MESPIPGTGMLKFSSTGAVALTASLRTKIAGRWAEDALRIQNESRWAEDAAVAWLTATPLRSSALETSVRDATNKAIICVELFCAASKIPSSEDSSRR